ncbi:MAG: cysteine desulfurase [Bacteroidales bacterium]|nr:cysteine desulfurase [Bacteroidales bacterium]
MDIDKIRADFPILSTKVRTKKLVYFDNGATSQKPQMVIDSMTNYYQQQNSNVHRGVHYLSQIATDAMESARENIRKYLNAASVEEVIFTKGTTESINLVANSFSKVFITEGDNIIVSEMEHHANIVPWQMMCKEKKVELKVARVNDDGSLDIDYLKSLFTDRTKLISLAHISNVMGVINPVKEIISYAHSNGAKVMLDGAQATPHSVIDMQDLDVDFFAFSAHKMYGPTGVGILYGKKKLLEQMPPYQFGGEMIDKVSFEETTFNVLPFKFEAGTPMIAEIIGLSSAIDYMQEIGIQNIADYEHELLEYATSKLEKIDGLRIIGDTKNKASVVSFVVKGVHHYDIGSLLDQFGIAVRTGNHCAQPLMKSMGISGTVRASFAFYNTKEEIDVFMEALNKALNMLT